MKHLAIATAVAVALAGAAVRAHLRAEAQSAQAGQVTGTVESHLAAAKTAAGPQFTALYNRICTEYEKPLTPPPPPGQGRGSGGGGRQAGPPPASSWHADPVKVFDNLYFVGMTEYSAWALTTSQGIIVIDAIYDYSVEDEVVNGLKTLGLNPADIKYVLVSHAHTDHIGGAKYLQDHFGARVVMSKEDWDVADRSIPERIRPKRDIEMKDGDKLTLGDTTITMYLTPGHTPGTISGIYQVKDRGMTHTVATWGGTAFNFAPKPENFLPYIRSAERYRDVVKKAGADILLSNHTAYDNTNANIAALRTRAAGARQPYVSGNDAILRYLTTAEECAKAGYLATSKLAATTSR
jgi:metallo-beta-lactamase class B